MFNIPITIPVRFPDGIYPMGVSVNMDEIALVKDLLDKRPYTGVESDTLPILPASEIILNDGRRLPVLETVATLHRYLDAYKVLEGFYTQGGAADVVEPIFTGGEVIPLFKGGPCDTSVGSTPA